MVGEYVINKSDESVEAYYSHLTRRNNTNGQSIDLFIIPDKHNVKGMLKYFDGEIYNGFWEKDRRRRRGNYTFTNGDIYDEEWYEDHQCGHGSFAQKKQKKW